MDITTLLERGQSPNASIRNEAEIMLRQLEANDYPTYILSLCNVFNGQQNAVGIQRLAAIILKNTLQSKDVATKTALRTKWHALTEPTRHEIHKELLRGLHHEEVDVSCTVSMVSSTVAAIDLPNNAWPELIPTLLQNMKETPVRTSLQRATLETMGYLCDELSENREFDLPSAMMDQMLTVIVGTMIDTTADVSVRLAATRALLNALEYTEKNFNNEQERNYIMEAVAHAATFQNDEVRQAGFECFVKICQLYYNLLLPYMVQLFKLTVETIQGDNEDIAKLAIEVWCTICEEEILLIQDQREGVNGSDIVLHNFALQACPMLVPILLDQLTKQDEDQELDECSWTLSMEAGVCLSLMSECVGSPIIPIVMPYVRANIGRNEGPDDWRYREAATYAFGAILDGPDVKELISLASSALPFLINAMRDQDPRVRNTTAWTIGRIFAFVFPAEEARSILNAEVMDNVITCLLRTIETRDELHILERVCYAIEKLASLCQEQNTISLAPYFKNLIEALLKLAFIPEETYGCDRIQGPASEAINALVRSAAPDSLDLVVQLIPYLSQKLNSTLRETANQSMARAQELQSMVCGCLTVVIHRLSNSEGHKVPLNQCASQIYALLLEVLQANGSDPTVMEEAMNTFSALVTAEVNCDVPIRSLVPHIEKGLRNHSEKYAFLRCIGAVSDLFSFLGADMEPYAQTVMTILCDTLSDSTVRREIKPPILSLMGDVCLAISDRFQKFLSVVSNILRRATEMAMHSMPRMDEEDVEYLTHLFIAIIEAYTGIAQGLSSEAAGQFLSSEYEILLKLMQFITNDTSREAGVTKEAIGLLGDIISKTPTFNPTLTERNWIERFIQQCLDSPMESIRKAASRTRLVYTRFLSSDGGL